MPASWTNWGKMWSGGKSNSLMLKFGYILLAISLCALVAHVHATANRPVTSSAQGLIAERPSGMRMDPFKKVIICAPFNVKIVPDADYKVAITADALVKDAISTRVQQDTLFIEVTDSFRTSNPIKLTVSLPHDQLQLVHNKAPESSVVVAAGFSVRRFTSKNASKAPLILKGLNADEALLESVGSVFHFAAFLSSPDTIESAAAD